MSRYFSAVCAFVVGLASMVVAVANPVAAHHDPSVTQTVVAFDTAWEITNKGSRAEQQAYLDHLVAAGFTGTWVAYLTTTGTAFQYPTVQGNMQASLDANDQIVLGQAYADDYLWFLDQAHARGLKVGFVAAWGVRYVHGDWANGFCTNLLQGPLKVDTSYNVGAQLAADFANHPAIAYWVLGGDNFCGSSDAEREDPQIWANLASGLRDGGVTKPITFHSSPLIPYMLEFIDEPWVDFLSIETGHCLPASLTESILADAVAHPSGKDIFAAEMRYESFEPDWEGCAEHGPGDPVVASDVADDTTGALRAGVSGLLFGHDDRWRWLPNALSTLGSPGEQAFLNLVLPHMADAPPPPPPPPPPPDDPPAVGFASALQGTGASPAPVAPNVTITGTATDDNAVQDIRVRVRNKATGEYWNGWDRVWQSSVAWNGGITANPGAASSDFALSGLLLAPGDYQLRVSATDSAGQVSEHDLTTIRVSSVLLSPSGVGVTEGDSGSFEALVPIRLSGPLPEAITVDYEAWPGAGTGRATLGEDFTGASGTLTIPAGETVGHVPVQIIGDTVAEPDFLWGEWGYVRFSNPSSNVDYDFDLSLFGLGLVVIVNDD